MAKQQKESKKRKDFAKREASRGTIKIFEKGKGAGMNQYQSFPSLLAA